MDKLWDITGIGPEHIQKVEAYLDRLNESNAEKYAVVLTRISYTEIDETRIVRFIKKYMQSKYALFIVEIYQYLCKNNKELAEEYIKLFANMKDESDEIAKKKKKTKMNDQNRKISKNIRRKTMERANMFVKSQKQERCETKEKIKQFYSDVQKYK